MGMTHYLAAQRLLGRRVTALHTRNPARLAGEWDVPTRNPLQPERPVR